MAEFIDRVALQNYIDEMPEVSVKEIRAKALDGFINQMEAEIESSAKFIREYDDSIAQKAYYKGLSDALEIAEQMKGEQNG